MSCLYIEELITHFQGVKRLSGRNHYIVLCPCHDDHKPSLDITEKDGKILMACPVCGADGKAVMNALGLPVRELFAEQRQAAQPNKPPSVDYLYTDSLKKTRFYLWNKKKQVYQKSFCWYHKNERGQWTKGLPKQNGRSLLPPLYKQNNIEWAKRRGKTLYLVEGEKDVDTLTKKLKLPAICSPHGAANAKNPAKKWDCSYNALFEGANVAIIPDNDEAGQAFARYVAEQLLPVAQSVNMLDLTAEWDNLPPKGDITDVYESEMPVSGKTIAETVAFRLQALTERTEVYVPHVQEEEAAPDYPIWTSGDGDSRKLNEQLYITDFIEQKQVRCINGKLYSVNGAVEDGAARQMIIRDILPYVKSNHGDKAKRLLRGIKDLCYTEPPKPDTERLHFANGTLSKDENGLFTVFSKEKEFCLNRFPVNYNPDAPHPELFLRYLNDVYQDDDQITIQQYCGYCLLPTTMLQKMLIVIGSGGEGKSVLRKILDDAFGNSNCIKESILTVESRFGVANLENKLLFIDDDVSENAIHNARNLKTLVTNDGMISAERKGVQENQINAYVRFICFGNFTVQALYDTSEGFTRRQLILETKPKNPNRTDIPFLGRKITQNELEGVMMWLVNGLNDFIKNGYKIAVSDRTQSISNQIKRENDTVRLFLEECTEIVIEPGAAIYSETLKEVYKTFCEENVLVALHPNTFISAVKSKGKAKGIRFSTHVIINGRRRRGFEGIGIKK